MSWLDDAMENMKNKAHEPKREVRRIVSFKVYQQAELAEADGATPRQIEMCLAGASWDWVKANMGETK